MPSTKPGAVAARELSSAHISRRRLLIGAAALATLGSAAACGTKLPPPEPDPLEDQLALARRDSEMASRAAAAADPFYAPPLTVVATEREEHAKALAEEIARAAEPTPTPSTIAGATSTSEAPTRPPPTRDEVIAALRESADSAAALAVKLSGYRAGLLGSIAASCASAVEVPLAMKKPA